MKERPILFSGPMVRAILEARKTQTRRVVKPQPEWDVNNSRWVMKGRVIEGYAKPQPKCPYGVPGDRLWVRETWSKALHGCGVELLERWEPGKEGPFGVGAIYAATPHPDYKPGKWKPSIHMPRWASRINLEVTGTRVERLQDISRQDAKFEGFWPGMNGLEKWNGQSYGNAQLAFEACWKDINGPGSWDANPWVWVVEFKKL